MSRLCPSICSRRLAISQVQTPSSRIVSLCSSRRGDDDDPGRSMYCIFHSMNSVFLFSLSPVVSCPCSVSPTWTESPNGAAAPATAPAAATAPAHQRRLQRLSRASCRRPSGTAGPSSRTPTDADGDGRTRRRPDGDGDGDPTTDGPSPLRDGACKNVRSALRLVCATASYAVHATAG